MHVHVKAFGQLCAHFGREPHDLELAEGSTLQDLLLPWKQQWKDRLPPSLWNRMEHRFRGPAVIEAGDRVVRRRATVLADGQDVRLYQALVGG